MFKQIDQTFEQICSIFLENGSSVKQIKKAYALAKDLHKTQVRKNGTPYLSHPVEVALILAQLGFDENVISAALLHDVVEDCGCCLQTLKKEFNNSVAEMVDCVSAIDKEKYIFDQNDIYEDKNFEKASIEEQSFKKLVAIGKKNPLGFCIKFADRLHNLRTIDCFEYSKQLEKVKETEKWIIPIANAVKAEFFYRTIKNECFKIKHKYDGKQYFEVYKNYHKLNEKNIEKLEKKLQEIFSNTFIDLIKTESVKEYKVFEDICLLLKNININKISQGQILKVTNYNIYLLFKDKKNKENIGNILNILNKKLNLVKIIDAKMGTFTAKPYYQLQDKYKNKYNLYFMSVFDYYMQKNGTLNGQNNELLDEDNIDNLEAELIRVKTRSGEIKYIQKGSTVLDFAFKIHKDIGFGFKYATINGSKTKAPPYTKLYEGDQVEIITEKDETGEIINCAVLKWLAYVNSDFAKKCLIKWFEQKL